MQTPTNLTYFYLSAHREFLKGKNVSQDFIVESIADNFPEPYYVLIKRLETCNPELVNLTIKEAAIFLRISVKKLDMHRVKGDGPAFKKLGGGRVLYSLKDLLAYLESSTRHNTCK